MQVVEIEFMKTATLISQTHGFLSDTSLRRRKQTSIARSFMSSVLLPVNGNVYPLGYFSVSLKIGNPPKVYDLDVDTGSDLTWVQCDAPCTGCTVPPERQYKPRDNLVPCGDPLCHAIYADKTHHCESPNDQCDYEVEYADHGSSLGVLVVDEFHFRLVNGLLITPYIAFGCGYDQRFSPTHPLRTAGVLGLGNGKASIVSQLRSLGLLTQNVIGHCFSGKEGGFLFFGCDLVPSSGITWVPMSRNLSSDKHYSLGPTELIFGGKPTGIKGLRLIFDSGSSYSYFNDQAYRNTLNLIRNDLKGKPMKPALEDNALPVCWKGPKPFQSVHEAKTYFKPMALRFSNANGVQLQIPPERYLIVTECGNVCLGILDGNKNGLGDFNIIGDVFLQEQMVVYDNEQHRIGWVPANCSGHPRF